MDDLPRSLFPVEHPKCWALFKECRNYTWKVESIDLSEEKAEFFSLDFPHRNVIRRSTVLAIAENVLFRTVSYDLLKDFTQLELLACISCQIAATQSHYEMYCRHLQNYVNFEDEKQLTLNALKTYNWFSEKANWLKRYSSSPAERVVTYACIKGIFGWSRFIATFEYKRDGRMTGLSRSNDLIVKDILSHMDLAMRMYELLDETEKLDESKVKEIIKVAVDIEIEAADELLNVEGRKHDREEHISCIKWCGDRMLGHLGYTFETPFPASFEWITNYMPKRELQNQSVVED